VGVVIEDESSLLHSPFLHLICEPAVDATLWASLYQSIFRLPNRNTSSIEEVLRDEQGIKVDADVVRKFGRFTCKPNPSCKSPSPDNKLCSPGVRMENFGKFCSSKKFIHFIYLFFIYQKSGSW
jgi:hypothetical protein